MLVNPTLRKILSETYPDISFIDYFAFIESTPPEEIGEWHHILPRKEFPNLIKETTNRIQLSCANHFKAHYWLAICAPNCVSFQRTLFFMTNQKTYKNIAKEDLPKFAEVYQIAREKHRQNVLAGWTESKRKRQSNIASIVNRMLLDFICPDCGQKFKQVTKGEFGGHRRFCVNYVNHVIPPRPFVLPAIETNKQCGKCGHFKSLSEFNKARKARLGVANWCRKCAKQHRKSGVIIGSNNLHNYVCSDCGQEFKQVKPGVFGGHRRACINYSERKLAFMEWNGSEQEFAIKHGLPLATVYRWSRL
jgi:DNA-directed RNA polymerase subunit RPC12/RpoP